MQKKRHNDQPLRNGGLVIGERSGVPSKNALCELINQYGMVSLKGSPGTVVFHEGNLLHASPDNLSPFSRTNLFFVYNSIENKPKPLPPGQEPRPEFLARHEFKVLKANSHKQ